MTRPRLLCLILLGGCYAAHGPETDAGVGVDGEAPPDGEAPRDLSVEDGGGATDLGSIDGSMPRDIGVVDIGAVDFGPPIDSFVPPGDGGGPRDFGPRPDGGPRPDLGISDAAVGLDSGPPPDPTGCRHRTPPRLVADGLREEAYWPGGVLANATSTPLVADLDPNDSDPVPSVVWIRSNLAETQAALTVAWSGSTLPTSLSAVNPDPTSSPGVADLDGDGDLEIVVLLQDRGLAAVHHTGAIFWTNGMLPTTEDRSDGGRPARGAAPTVADLDGDGRVEVIVGRLVFDGRTGAAQRAPLVGDRGIHAGVGPIACVGDVDRDGMMEVVAGGTAYGAGGAVRWDAPAVPDGLCALGDVLADPGPEVVVVALGELFVLSGSTGAVLERLALRGTSPAGPGGGPPALADVDGDGFVEIAVAHGDALAVYDFDCAGCMGDVRWTSPMVETDRTAGVSFGDLNGDGDLEIYAMDRFSLMVRDGRTGALVANRITASVNITQAPIIADVDLDGDAELLVPSSRLVSNSIYVEAPRPGLQILGRPDGSWTGVRSIWNQHAFHAAAVTSGAVPIAAPLGDFRAQAPSADPLVLPNLVGSATVECLGGGQALIRVSALNAGLGPAGDFQVELTRGVRDLPVTIVGVAGPLNPSDRADVAIFEAWRPPMQVYVDRRRDGNVFECNERDNRVDLPDIECP